MPFDERREEQEKMAIQEDRISILPDVLLHQIPVLIDLKEVVQTSILSKRWRHLWATLPIPNFDFLHMQSVVMVIYLLQYCEDAHVSIHEFHLSKFFHVAISGHPFLAFNYL